MALGRVICRHQASHLPLGTVSLQACPPPAEQGGTRHSPSHCGAAQSRPSRGNLAAPSGLSHRTESFQAAAWAETVLKRQAGKQREGSTELKAREDAVSTAIPRAVWQPSRVWDKRGCDPGPRPPQLYRPESAPAAEILVTGQDCTCTCWQVVRQRQPPLP